MKHILIAPNAFKNSLTATDAAKAIERGLRESNFDCTTEIFPVGDGGDGTCELIHEKLKGRLIYSTASDPLNRKIKAPFSLIRDGKTAVIEMADASGLRLIQPEERDPLITTSKGTGELIKAALNQGAEEIVLGMGGSATVDGGCGILYALGVRFLDGSGKELFPVPDELVRLAKVDTDQLDKRLGNCRITILCDVKNKLLGENGAAAVFGPQKGATMKDVKLLENFLVKLSAIALENTGKDIANIISGGAAGGAAAGMYGFADAVLVNGIEYFLKLTGFEQAVINADLVITGEGSIDDQTLEGKGPYGVAMVARRFNKPVIGVAGKIPLHFSEGLSAAFKTLIPINNQLMSLQQALDVTETNLERTGKMVGDLIA